METGIGDMIHIYVDGAGINGPGGWGCYFIYPDGTNKSIYGGEKNTTNNRMELTAAIMALTNLEPGSEATLYSDSEYVVKGITRWIHYWITTGMLFGNKIETLEGEKELKNRDLWKLLWEKTANYQLKWQWVPGHSDVKGNVIADSLAIKGKAQVREYLATDLLQRILGSDTLNPTAKFNKDGSYKNTSIALENMILTLEGSPDRTPSLSINIKHFDPLSIEDIKDKAKNYVSKIEIKNVNKKQKAAIKQLGFLPKGGKDTARTFIFSNEVSGQKLEPNA